MLGTATPGWVTCEQEAGSQAGAMLLGPVASVVRKMVRVCARKSRRWQSRWGTHSGWEFQVQVVCSEHGNM